MSAEVILEPLTIFLSIISGVLVGSSLGLIGGGGSVLAVPLLLSPGVDISEVFSSLPLDPAA